MNVVLDTNCLVMAISERNRYNIVWQRFLEGKYTLCLSNEIIEEYEEVLARNLSVSIAETFVTAILNRKNIRLIDPFFAFHLIENNPDDNKFVDCAISANAKYIVYQDHHFNALKHVPFPKIDVISIQQFVEELAQI